MELILSLVILILFLVGGWVEKKTKLMLFSTQLKLKLKLELRLAKLVHKPILKFVHYSNLSAFN